jgi:hypothetical protein
MNITAVWPHTGVRAAIHPFPFPLAATSGSHALPASRRPSDAGHTFTGSQPVWTLVSAAGVEISSRVRGDNTDLLHVSCKY